MADAKLLESVEKLLVLGDGDLERLVHMKHQLKQDEELHPSDRKYLMKLVTDYLEPYEKYHSDDLAKFMNQTEKSPYEIHRDENKKHYKKNLVTYIILVLISAPLLLYWRHVGDIGAVETGVFAVILGTVYIVMRFWRFDLSSKLTR